MTHSLVEIFRRADTMPAHPCHWAWSHCYYATPHPSQEWAALVKFLYETRHCEDPATTPPQSP